MEFTAVFEKVPEDIAFVEELPGANTQGAILEEARENLREAIELVLEANRTLAEESIQGREIVKERLPAHQGRCPRSQPRHPLGHPRLIADHPQPLLGRPDGYVQIGFGDIDPDPAFPVKPGRGRFRRAGASGVPISGSR